MKGRYWLVLIVSLVLLAMLLLPACSSGTTATVTQTTTKTTGTTSTTTATTTAVSTTTEIGADVPQYGGTLRIIWSMAARGAFGWAPQIFGGNAFLVEPVLETLIESKFTGGFVPRLATDWDISDDGLTMTFTLRRGVKFHDGTGFNADAVKYNLDAMMEAGRLSSDFESVEVVDDYMVKVHLNKFRNTSLSSVAGVYIVSPTAVETNGVDWAAENAIGTGPFKQVAYEPDVMLRMERFDDYWGGKPYLDAIEEYFISETMTQVMAMQSGEADVTHSRQAKVIYDLAQSGLNIDLNLMGMVAANLNSKDADSPFANLDVRKAFEYAIDKQPLVDNLGYGYWEVGYQFPLPGQNGYVDDLEYRVYDPDKARELLAGAGFGGGFNTKLVHRIGDFEDGVAYMQANLAAVGINAEIDSIDSAAWGAARQEGWEGAFVCGSGIIPDYNNMLETYFSPGRTEMFSIKRPDGYTDLVEETLSANPPDGGLTQECARIIHDQVFWVVIEHHGDNYAYTNKVHGLNFGDYGQYGSMDAEKVWLSK